MNLEEGINRLSQLFMSANAFMDKKDYRAAINEYNKIIELVQILRKPFDNGEVPLNLVTTVLPKILEAEKAARSAISVAQLGIEAQKKSLENPLPQNDKESEDIKNYNLNPYHQHMQTAIDYLEKGDYNSALDEFKNALERVHFLRRSAIKQADEYQSDLFVKTMINLANAEISVHQGLFSAYVRMGNLEKAAEEEKLIAALSNSSDTASNPVSSQNKFQSDAQTGGCFSAMCFMFAILAALIFY